MPYLIDMPIVFINGGFKVHPQKSSLLLLRSLFLNLCLDSSPIDISDFLRSYPQLLAILFLANSIQIFFPEGHN